MGEHIAHAAPADRQPVERDRAAAAHFGADRDQAGGVRRGHGGALVAQIGYDDIVGRIEGPDGGDVAAVQVRSSVGSMMALGNMSSEDPPRMQIEKRIGHRKNPLRDGGRRSAR